MTLDQKAAASVSLRAAGSKTRLAARLLLSVAPAALMLPASAIAQELPSGGSVAAGTATIATPAPGQMTINQGSNAAIVNWNSFSVGQGGQVDITQPGAQSALLNRVTGDTTSAIHGQINANGQVFVVNPNGIFIGPTGQINTSGFVASTLDIGDDDFMAGRYRFEGNGNSATVENAGLIQSVPGGYAALIGGKVKNSGVIRVPLGKVGLGAGEDVTLDFTGDGFLQVAVPSEGDDTMEALVENSGMIEANGGQVQLLAASARDAARQVVNMSGVIEARSVSGRNGAVVLGGSGGGVQVSGRIDTSAEVVLVSTSPRPVARPVRGGDITITGEAITLTGADLNASGAGAGDGGNIRIGGNHQGAGNLQRALNTFVDAATTITADGGDEGNGGRIIVWSDIFTEFDGTNSARGGDLSGDGGFVEVSGAVDLRYRGMTDTRAPNGATGELLLDPGNITVPGTFDAATISGNLGTTDVTLDTMVSGSGAPGNITIDDPITWASANQFELIADNNIILNAAITGTSGTFALNAPGTITTGAGGAVDVGTFLLNSGSWQQVGSTIPSFSAGDFQIGSSASFLRALGGTGGGGTPYELTDIYGVQGIGSLSGSPSFVLANDIDATGTTGWNSGAGFASLDFGGTLDGAGYTLSGLFKNDSTSGGLFDNLISATVTNLRLSGANITASEGGVLAASNSGGSSITNTSAQGTFTGNSGGSGGNGGLVGVNSGTIQDSFADVVVAATSGGGATFHRTGGLVGTNAGTITRSHAAGAVTGTSTGPVITETAGGLVGFNSGTIQSSYATGATEAIGSGGAGAAGGLVGLNEGSVVESYSTGTATVGGFDVPAAGGLVAINQGAGSVTGSFWDTDLSGETSSAGGTGLTTLEFQDTDGFFAVASAAGWDFANDWAPGAPGLYPLNYTTSPVVFVQPNALTVQYGLTGSTPATGSITGGPGVYVFDVAGDTLDTSGVLSSLTYDQETVGAATFVPTTTSLNSSLGETYDVVSLTGDATITPAPLTVTADDRTRTYGDSFSLGTTDYAVTGTLYFGDTIDEVTLTSAGEAVFAPVAGSPYTITASDAAGDAFDANNYAITYVPGTLTINPAPLTVTADSLSRVYGDGFSFAGTEFTVSGLLSSSDTVDSVTLSSAGAAQFASVAGSPYTITPSAAVGSGVSNYAITYVPGTLTISPALLTITADDLTRVYGDGFSFSGTEFTATGLLQAGDITSVDLTSAGAAQFAPVFSGGEPVFYTITASNAAGPGAGNYDISYETGELEIFPAPLSVTPDTQVKFEGEEFEFTGTEFTAVGLVNPADSVGPLDLFSEGADADAAVAGSPYAIVIETGEGGISGSGLENYVITLNDGEFFVLSPGVLVTPPPIPVVDPTPPGETEITIEIDTGGGGGGTAVNPVVEAEATLGTVQDVSSEFEDEVSACASEDVSEYLACMADAMDAYGEDLDAIAQGLPPGLETIGDIIQGASAGIRAAGEKAQARLALATTEAERQQIRREAVQEARAAIRTAQTEIRKAIRLIRAEDPELVSLQREQVETIVAAVGSADIGLSRVLEL